MAGAKESPRQKMIGMMYLVLTALLALQVSSAIIEKFIFLNESLEYTVGEADKRNGSTVDRIKKAVAERPQDAAVLESAEQVRNATAKMIAEIDGLKEDLIKKSGGIDPETKSYKGAKEEEAVAIYMVGGKKNGKAYDLKKDLNNFSDELSKHNPTPFTKLALDGDQDPMFKDKPDQKNKDFAELNFAQTPMVAALAVLSQKEAEIRRMESQALDNLASKVGAKAYKVDKVFAMASPESRVVAAGTKYKAQMFIAASFGGIKPSMKFNGGNIQVDAEGRGTVEFPAHATNYDKDGNSKQIWTGEVTLKNPATGKDTTYILKEEYIVAKPVIQVQSASVQALYLNCGNELNIQVPALGSVYDPSFSASGASVVKGANKGLITVIPNAAQVTINVSSGGNAIGSEKFQVRTIPKPTIEVYAGGKPVNEKQGMAIPRSLEIAAIPDESFKNFLPKDARYRVSEWEVTLARGSRPVGAPITVTASSVSLGSLASQAKPGDRLVIEVKTVQRMNYQGQVETVKMPTIYKNVSIN